MIEVERLHKEYVRGQGKPALADVSFTARSGEVVGLLGPNGAGKTTLLRILAGVLFPSAGTARLCGHDIIAAPRRARAELGYLPEQVPLDGELRVSEYLQFRAAQKGVAAPRQAVAAALDEVGLKEGAERRLIGELSKGLRQRVGLADALLHRPQVLLLDEPTDGLDPNQRRETLGLIKRLGAQHTVVLSTHVLPEVESVCHRVVVLDRGQLVAAGTPSELGARNAGAGQGQLELVCRGDEERLTAALRALPSVAAVQRLHGTKEIQTLRIALAPGAPETTVEELARVVIGIGELRSLQPAPSSLEAVFRFLTTPSA
jgi:ABC-2 type transport system ATP-binding protein